MHLHDACLLLLLLFSVNMQYANATRMCLRSCFITKICRLIKKIGKKPKKAENIKEKVEEIINEIESYKNND